MKASRGTSLAVLVLLAFALGSCGRMVGQRALSPAEREELDALASQLADPNRSAEVKLEAAALLLTRPYGEAEDVLRSSLTDSANRAGQLAVVEAIARHGGGRKAFVAPLGAVVRGGDAAVREAAGMALATYKDSGAREKLIEIARDTWADRQVRLVGIRSLALVLDKRTVEAMIPVLDDPDESIREAAAAALEKLTNIRTFGSDAGEWKRWWARNKGKDEVEWLRELADDLNKSKTALESENARLRDEAEKTRTSLESENAHLRDRLVRATSDLYAAASPVQREPMLLGFLKDPLPDVRLVGTKLTYRRLAASEPIGEEIRLHVRTMLTDPEAAVRASSAMLLANLNDGDSLAALLERLKVERENSVRVQLLTALGQLRDPKGLPAVLGEIPSEDDATSAAAAAALARIVEANPLDEVWRTRTVQALIARYNLAAKATNGAALREALVSAMGKVKDKAFAEVLRSALRDRAATVRLAGVGALASLGNNSSAAIIEPLVGDEDRGVRQAAISAIGALGGKEHLGTIMLRTDPAVETDAAVRKQAWSVAMAILTDASADDLRRVAAALASRPDATDERIQILQMLVGALGSEGGHALSDAQRQLGGALVGAGRPAEAGPHLAEAWKIRQADGSPEASKVWMEWTEALLAAYDPTVIKAMNEQTDDDCFARTLLRVIERLSELKGEKKHTASIMLAEAALKELPHRLTVEQREVMAQFLTDARTARQTEDRREVGKLVGQLTAPDEDARKTAVSKLQTMGTRAVAPLLEELQKCISAEAPDAELEAAIAAALGQVAPDLKGYDPAAPLSERIKLIDTWLKNRE